ncbi:F0F1 ATP synthase subunit B [Aureibacillus halotolerans]|nr:F0F1 ATP synthase subunit B [Aureibacillus halotolerans]
MASGLAIGDIFVQLLAFALLLLLLKKFALKPLIKVMKDRETFVANEIDSAETSRKEAESFLKQQQETLEAARKEAQAILENAKKMGEDRQSDILKAAQDEAERLREAAIRDIQNEREQALVSVREQVASLSVLIASKVIEKELNAADQEKLIEDYIKEAGDQR